MATKTSSRTAEAYGWTGRLLSVDLTTGELREESSLAYVDQFIGGRGLAARLAWERIRPGVGALDPGNVLIFSVGPLCGTAAPFSGRTNVSGLSPQAYPREWYSRSNLGGHWGAELKYAGYDAIVVTGASPTPVYLWVCDGTAELRDARPLWGLGTIETQKQLAETHGPEARAVAIGQAGEHLSRIAIINSGTESAAGQGGFGAVMGAKKLKAIAVRGTLPIAIAHPDEFLRVCRAVAGEAHGSHGWPIKGTLDPERVRQFGERFQACTRGCAVPCVGARYYRSVPGVVHNRTYSGQLHCIAWLFQGLENTVCNWKVGFQAGFELSYFANEYGLNHWDLLFGIAPWLRECQRQGLISTLDGLPIDFDDPHFWLELLRRIAYREGLGDTLAEGGLRAAGALHLGEEILKRYYTAWGSAGHWDGHSDHENKVVFPYWLVSALQWAVDTRDPMSGEHAYAQNLMCWSPLSTLEGKLTWEQILGIGRRLYGSERAVDPRSGYDDKAYPAVWHGHRSMLKDSLSLDDQMFPRIYSRKTEDGFARADGMEGPDFEYHLVTAATGHTWTREDLMLACERAFNLERAIQVRQHGRSRQVDESVIPHFARVENWANPLTGERRGVDPDRFRALLDEYYALRGWDPATGRPTRQTLERLGLADVATELAGAGLI